MVEDPPAGAGDVRTVGLIPELGRSSGGRHGNPLQYSCLENPMVWGVHRVAESDTTEVTWCAHTWSDAITENLPLCTSTKLNLRCRILGDLVKNIALPSKGGHCRLMPSKLCIPTWGAVVRNLMFRVWGQGCWLGWRCMQGLHSFNPEVIWHQVVFGWASVVFEVLLWLSVYNEGGFVKLTTSLWWGFWFCTELKDIAMYMP